MKFRELKGKEKAAFMATTGVRNVGPHSMSKMILSWPFCSRCGLVAFRNKATKRELKKPCVEYL